MRLAITTSLHPSPAESSAAEAAAARHALPLAPRARLPLSELASASCVEGLLVLTSRAATLWTPEGERTWSPGMGLLRLRRTQAAARGGLARPTGRDPMLEAAGLRPGDTVLDATLGLGADALVAAGACGPEGRVVACEASAALAAWVAEGLRRLPSEAAARIEVRAGDHAAQLAALPDGSFDVVLFDPMFRHPRAEPGQFDVVRRLADARPLQAEALRAARRVARRWVVVKDGAPGWDLTRLGLTPLPSARGAHRYYARVPALGAD